MDVCLLSCAIFFAIAPRGVVLMEWHSRSVCTGTGVTFVGFPAVAEVDEMGRHDGEDGGDEEKELAFVPDLFEYEQDDADREDYDGGP